MNIGDKIRKLRKQENITLKELSQKSGVALATLSRMENNKMTGTFESHVNIAKALGVALPELYSDVIIEEKKAELLPHSATSDTFVHSTKSSFKILANKVLSKKMMPVLLTIQPAGRTNKEEAQKGSEKFIYVLEGELEAVIGDERYKVGKKDSLYFYASSPHYFINIGKGPVSAICVICPPAL